MTPEVRKRIEDASLRFAQVSRSLACLRRAVGDDDVEAGDALALLEQFTSWAADDLDKVLL